MKVQIIKREIPEEISAAGGASVIIVNKDTISLETSIDEAKDSLMVVGDQLLIKGMFVGLFKSMMKGIERDGNARQLGDFLTLYPVPTGTFDLDTGWNPLVNDVKIRVRLLNEMELDISKWEFEDVTPGRQSFTLESIKAGDTTGVVKSGQPVEINGRNLPLTADVRVDWALEDGTKSGTVAGTKVTSTATRADIAADGLTGLGSTDSGKKIIFTVRGNYAKASISAVYTYVSPTVPTITTVHGVDRADGQIQRGDKYVIEGAMLDKLDLDTLHGVSWYVNGVVESTSFDSSEIESKTATQIVLNKTLPDNADIGKAVTLTLNFVEPYESKTGSATVVAA